MLRQVAPRLGLAKHGFKDFHGAIGCAWTCCSRKFGMPPHRISVGYLINELARKSMIQMGSPVNVLDFAR